MKNIRLVFLFAAAAFLAACANKPPDAPLPKPSTTPQPKPQWIFHAKLIETKNLKIYYEGMARGSYSDDYLGWRGHITGKAYARIKSASSNWIIINLPNGTLTIRSGDVSVAGPHTITITDPPTNRGE